MNYREWERPRSSRWTIPLLTGLAGILAGLVGPVVMFSSRLAVVEASVTSISQDVRELRGDVEKLSTLTVRK